MNNLFKKGLILSLFSLVITLPCQANEIIVEFLVLNAESRIETLYFTEGAESSFNLKVKDSEAVFEVIKIDDRNLAKEVDSFIKRLNSKSELIIYSITNFETKKMSVQERDGEGWYDFHLLTCSPKSFEYLLPTFLEDLYNDLGYDNNGVKSSTEENQLPIATFLVVQMNAVKLEFILPGLSGGTLSLSNEFSPFDTMKTVRGVAYTRLLAHSKDYSSAQVEAMLEKSGYFKDSNKFVYHFLQENKSGDKSGYKKAAESKENSSEEHKEESKTQ